jgi:hypothetical protein
MFVMCRPMLAPAPGAPQRSAVPPILLPAPLRQELRSVHNKIGTPAAHFVAANAVVDPLVAGDRVLAPPPKEIYHGHPSDIVQSAAIG